MEEHSDLLPNNYALGVYADGSKRKENSVARVNSTEFNEDIPLARVDPAFH